jgi:hypothetical protein
MLYDHNDASRQLSISVRSLDCIIAGKRLETRRSGKNVLVTHASLSRYASANHFETVMDGAAREFTATLNDVSSKCA